MRNIIWNKCIKQYLLVDTALTFDEGWETALFLCTNKDTEEVPDARGLGYWTSGDPVMCHRDVVHDIKRNGITLHELYHDGDFTNPEECIKFLGGRIAASIETWTQQSVKYRLFLNGEEITKVLPEGWQDCDEYDKDFPAWRERNLSWLEKVSRDIGIHKKIFNAKRWSTIGIRKEVDE